MPDLNPDGTVYEPPPPPANPETAHLAADVIARCRLCDPDGYTPARVVCDHQDHTRAALRGKALVQAELDRIRQRRVERARAESPASEVEE